MKATVRWRFPFPTASFPLVMILKDNFLLLAGMQSWQTHTAGGSVNWYGISQGLLGRM